MDEISQADAKWHADGDK